jgi:biopolymer transport protein ExbD
MRIPSAFRERTSGVELQLTPMIDCVFLLMVYFIWTSSFAVAELTLPSRLSAAPRSGANFNRQPLPEADFPDVVVRILWTGSGPAWTVNEQPVSSLAELRQMLGAVARLNRDAPVILDPTGDVPLGDVIDVFDLSRVVGFQKVQFTASMDERG